MSLPIPRIRPAVLALGLAAAGPLSFAQEALDVGRYVEIVKRSHPAAAERAGLEQAAEAERRAARVLPDPVFDFSWDRAHPTDLPGAEGGRDRLRALADPALARDLSRRRPTPATGPPTSCGPAPKASPGRSRPGRGSPSRGSRRPAACWTSPAGPRRTRAPCATSSRGARSWASRASPTASRPPSSGCGSSASSPPPSARRRWPRRSCGRSRSSPCLGRCLLKPTAHPPLPPLDPAALAARLVETNPRLRAARAEAARREALSSVARRARIPDLDVSVFRQRELDKEANGFSVGIKLPLWNANRGEIARAEAEQRIAARGGGAGADRRRSPSWRRASRISSWRRTRPPSSSARSCRRPRAASSSRGSSTRKARRRSSTSSTRSAPSARRSGSASQSHLAQAFAVADVQRLAGPDFDPWR